MNLEELLPILTVGGTLLLVLTGLLNFSVFVRQLRAARSQLDTARKQLDSARQQSAIQLVQRHVMETSDHLKVLVDKPYLRPYFYEDIPWREGDEVSADEIKALAELMLNNFASAIIHWAAFPQYPVRGVEQTIRFHLRHSPALRDFLLGDFDRFQLTGLTLLCLKNETKAGIEADLKLLVAAPGLYPEEKARREKLLRHLQTTLKTEPWELAEFSLEHIRSQTIHASEDSLPGLGK